MSRVLDFFSIVSRSRPTVENVCWEASVKRCLGSHQLQRPTCEPRFVHLFAEGVAQRWRPRFETVLRRGTVGAGLGLTRRVVRGSKLPGMRGSIACTFGLLPRFPQ